MAKITFPFLAGPDNFSKTLLAIFQLVYGVPSILLMFFLFVFLGCSKKYSSSFYRLVQVDLLTNIVCWLNTWISLRSSEYPFGTAYVTILLAYMPWLWNVSALLLNFFFHMQFCSAASLSIHRISSILFFNHYEKFWSRYYIPVHIMFFVYSWVPQLISAGSAPQMNLVNGTLLYTIDLDRTANFQLSVQIFSGVYFVLLVGVSFSIPKIAEIKFQSPITDNSVSKKLTRIALVYGFVYSGILFWNIINALQAKFEIFPKAFGPISYSLLSVADLVSSNLFFFNTEMNNIIKYGSIEGIPLYNCSGLTPEEWSKEKGYPRPIAGTIDMTYGITMNILYLPILSVMFEPENFKMSCFKIMTFLGIVDMLALWVNSIITGFLAYQGAVYCTYPNLIYITGMAGLGLWCCSCIIAMSLVINRLLDLTKESPSTQIFFQSALICAVNQVASVIYVIMNFIEVPLWLIMLGHMLWQTGHGAPVFIYLGLNKKIRTGVLKRLGIKTESMSGSVVPAQAAV
ncbi:Protein CBG06649 [Caenorhabditis briggsae]|uniref:Serpentine receptor class gamma n=1 Tax=Caenorhabditis briggsae TaxID=6238 RepID=A8X2R7_CAEBR|nr:Protein CBG06649 [Caenorhabditis briggsae]CAP26927.2 Protein CBG06649 [Caenorhabditis briggsae]